MTPSKTVPRLCMTLALTLSLVGGVAHAPMDSLCSDSNVCNGDETCSPALDCQPGEPLVVDDGVGCTVDTCDPVTGAVHSPNDGFCSNNDVCDGSEVCDVVNDCQPGTPLVVDDGVTCTVDSCDPGTGTITNVPTDSLCDDGNVCDGSETCDAFISKATRETCITSSKNRHDKTAERPLRYWS